MTRNDIINYVLTDPRTPSFQNENKDLYNPEYLNALNDMVNYTTTNKQQGGTSQFTTQEDIVPSFGKSPRTNKSNTNKKLRKTLKNELYRLF